MRNPWKVIAILNLAGAIAMCAPVRAQDLQPGSGFLSAQAAPAQASEDQAYEAATALLNESKWESAAEQFGKVADLQGKRADAARYWEAYALNKQGKRSEALATVDTLRKQYPHSTWIKDASALEVEIRQASGQSIDPQVQYDDETKILALNALMSSDPQRAVPVLEKILASTSSNKVKSQALFVLAQSDSVQAQQSIVAAARGSAHPELQRKAIEYLGTQPSPQHLTALAEVFRNSNDPEVKRAVLNAYVICGCRDQIFEIAKETTDPSTKRAAIHSLIAVGGRNELRQMFSTAKSTEEKRELIQAFIATGDRQSIDQAYKNATTTDEKRNAIQAFIALGDREAIHRAYDQANSAEEKRAAFEGFIALGDRDAIRDAFKNAKTPEERKAAIQGFIALGDSGSIAKGIQTASDDDTKIALIHAYAALSAQPATTSTLLQMYSSESSLPVKKAVINALFVGGDAKELVALDRKEHDPELHRSIVQQLSVMNNPAAKDYMLEILNR